VDKLKLVTFKAHTEERVGVVLGGHIIDINALYAKMLESKGRLNPRLWADAITPSCMLDFLRGGEGCLEAAEKALQYFKSTPDVVGIDGEKTAFPRDEVRLLAPVPRPGKVYCAAVNFYDHATESIKDPEKRLREIERLKSLSLDTPDIFQKPPSLVVGPEEPLIKPRASEKMDYECELAVVIGKRGKYIKAEEAYDHIAGYTIFIDVSFRDQGFPQDVDFRMFKNDINWTKGKGMDNAAPMGPCILTRDELPELYNPPLNKIPRIIEYLSDGITLVEGDIIATGTVAGVARSWTDGFLKVGDLVECEIPPIGILKHRVVAEPSN
jgi:2-keto-4-pentenoate hydratase/2-oxohepta-3-ene-1,7-dioic acid hydratase in catechol pathway